MSPSIPGSNGIETLPHKLRHRVDAAEHHHPYAAIGLAAVVGRVVGFLAPRR